MAKDPPRGNRKRPFGATVRSLHDITNNSASGPGLGDNDASSSGGTGGAGGEKIALAHIPSLPQHEEAAAILKRIHSEFHVLIERRGWTVTSITEMCCCADGIDCLKKRKTKTMPDNVLGYNRSSYGRGKTVHDIHLRLRHPRTHELVDYESIAATMCHELAHCVRGPHDAKFYKAMEEIEEQYAVFLAKGVVVDKDGFPIGSTEAHVLGKGGGGANSRNNAPADRRRALEAAEKRRKRNQNGLTQGYVLGGRQSLGKKDPREAARIAAERRLLDSQYCLPCNEIIEILGEDSDDEVIVDDDSDVEVVESSAGGKTVGFNASDDELDRKPRAKSDTTTTSSDGVIDLTSDDSFETSSASPIGNLKLAAQPQRNNPSGKTAGSDDGCTDWTCPRCTLCNSSMILVCDACNLERPCDKTILEQALEMKKADDIEDVKEREVQQSKETFGGFNIYGKRQAPSSTMKHLT